MSINFDNTAYFRALNINDIADFKNEIGQGYEFEYKSASYADFSEKYRSSAAGWLLRKIVAIPFCLYAGLIKSIYHLALSVFTNTETSKKAFRAIAVRNLQESLGWIALLLHDRYGIYVIQAADFHTTCQEILLEHRSSTTVSEKEYLEFFESLEYFSDGEENQNSADFTPSPSYLCRNPQIQDSIARSDELFEAGIKEAEKQNEAFKLQQEKTKLHNQEVKINNKAVVAEFNKFLLADELGKAKEELKNYQSTTPIFGWGSDSNNDTGFSCLEELSVLEQRYSARMAFKIGVRIEDVLELIKYEPYDAVKFHLLDKIVDKAIAEKKFDIVVKVCESCAKEANDKNAQEFAEMINKKIEEGKNQK